MDPTKINILNFEEAEFSSSQYILTSPRSLRACHNLEIKTKYCQLSPSKLNEIFLNTENHRQELIRSCIEERNRIINLEEKQKPISSGLFLCGTSIFNRYETNNQQSSFHPSDIDVRLLATLTKSKEHYNNKFMLYRKQHMRERYALLRKQELEKQKQAQKEEWCRIAERRARKFYSDKSIPLSATGRGYRGTGGSIFTDSAKRSSRFDGEIRRRAELERIKLEEEVRNIDKLKQLEEEKRIVAMETTSRPDDHAKRVAEEKELHIMETRLWTQEAARLREEIRRTYQLDSFDKIAKEAEIRSRIGL